MRVIFMSWLWLLGAGGCAATASSNRLSTDEVIARIDVAAQPEADSSKSHFTMVTASLLAAPDADSNVVLGDGDRLTATLGTQTRAMEPVAAGTYGTHFPWAEGEIVVSFERVDATGAPTSRGTLGPGFHLETRPLDTPVSRRAGVLELSWAPVDPQAFVVVEIEGACVQWVRKELGQDVGSVQLTPEEMRPVELKENQSCPVDVVISRTRPGVPDPALAHRSRVQVRQVRRTRFLSGP